MCTDGYLSSILLGEKLIKLKCHLTDTVQMCRKVITLWIAKPNIKDTTVAYKKHKKMLLAQKDKRIVTLLSSNNSSGIKSKWRLLQSGKNDFLKPNVIVNFTTCMREVIPDDDNASTY